MFIPFWSLRKSAQVCASLRKSAHVCASSSTAKPYRALPNPQTQPPQAGQANRCLLEAFGGKTKKNKKTIYTLPWSAEAKSYLRSKIKLKIACKIRLWAYFSTFDKMRPGRIWVHMGAF